MNRAPSSWSAALSGDIEMGGIKEGVELHD